MFPAFAMSVPQEVYFANGGGNTLRVRNQGTDVHQRLQSKVVSSANEKSREEALAEQRQDGSGRDRNRRMFGALLGTLHRFKQDETKLKEKEEKRAQIEAKLEEQAMQEKETVKKEKQKQIREHKLKLAELKRSDFKKHRLEQLEDWEEKTNHLRNFIRTESKPNIFYLPKQMNPITECRLDESKQIVEEMIANKRKLVLSELESYEEQNRRYWEHRLDGYQQQEQSQNRRQIHSNENRKLDREVGTGRQISDALDINMEDELKALMHDEISVSVSSAGGENVKRRRIASTTSEGTEDVKIEISDSKVRGFGNEPSQARENGSPAEGNQSDDLDGDGEIK